MYTELTEDNLATLLTDSKNVMVQFGATWCGNCKITKPKFKNFAEQHDDILFVYVDAEKFPNSRKQADVSNLPTFAAFSDGKLNKQLQGNKTEVIKEVLDALISH
jgi:thiol-disulfide isomerase/thioredoxin